LSDKKQIAYTISPADVGRSAVFSAGIGILRRPDARCTSALDKTGNVEYIVRNVQI